MSDIPRLEFSPLTHKELNDRVDQLRDDAGGLALATVRLGHEFGPTTYDRLARIEDEYKSYLDASIARIPFRTST